MRDGQPTVINVHVNHQFVGDVECDAAQEVEHLKPITWLAHRLLQQAVCWRRCHGNRSVQRIGVERYKSHRSQMDWVAKINREDSAQNAYSYSSSQLTNKKHLKNVGPIRHCEPPHAELPLTRCRYCRTPPAHRCPRQRQRRQQRQRVTEGTAMAP